MLAEVTITDSNKNSYKKYSPLSLLMMRRFVIYGDGLHLFGKTEPKNKKQKIRLGNPNRIFFITNKIQTNENIKIIQNR